MKQVTLEEMIGRLREQRLRWGLPVPSPCPDTRLQELPKKVRQELGATIPTRYLDILRIVDGIDENALTIYASKTARVVSDEVGRELQIEGIVKANQYQRTEQEIYYDLILFAYREGMFYAQVIETEEFIKFDEANLSNPVLTVYGTFDEMMIAAIQSALIE